MKEVGLNNKFANPVKIKRIRVESNLPITKRCVCKNDGTSYEILIGWMRSFLVVVHDPGVELVAEVLKVPGAKLYPARCTAVAIGLSSDHHRRRTHSVGLSEPVVHVILLQLANRYSVLNILIGIENIQRVHRILIYCPFARVHVIVLAELYPVLPSIVYKFAAILLEDS